MAVLIHVQYPFSEHISRMFWTALQTENVWCESWCCQQRKNLRKSGKRRPRILAAAPRSVQPDPQVHLDRPPPVVFLPKMLSCVSWF